MALFGEEMAVAANGIVFDTKDCRRLMQRVMCEFEHVCGVLLGAKKLEIFALKVLPRKIAFVVFPDEFIGRCDAFAPFVVRPDPRVVGFSITQREAAHDTDTDPVRSRAGHKDAFRIERHRPRSTSQLDVFVYFG